MSLFHASLATRTSGSRFGDLALLMDLFSRRIVGGDFGLTMDEERILGARQRTIRERQPRPGLIHHTDRGGQYASARYRAVLRRAEICQSMNAAGNCYDNAFLESCFGTIQQELELVEYRSSAEALRELLSEIRYDNAERIPSSLGYVSPAQFETQPPPGK